MDSREGSIAHNYVFEDVINKSRNELVYNGQLEESVLRQIQSIWKTKMIQAGVTIESSASSASVSNPTPMALKLQTPDPKVDAQSLSSKPSMDVLISTKRENQGLYIPQLDGARDEDVLDENEELLNEDDDDDEDDMDDDDPSSIPHLVMCQFVDVKHLRKKNKYECSFKAGVMQMNGKSTLFSQAKGDFNY